MEFIRFGRSGGDQSALGRKLAEMHKAAKSDKGYGFYVENTIGSTTQINTWTADWIEFYSKHRLRYQLELISQQFGDSAIYEKGQQLIENIHPLFEGAVIEPYLLHGDLWSGNINSDTNGDPVILDPACYYGHNEAEFGMSWCAGFGGAIYNSYFEVMPKQPGFAKRRDLYLLYHYLNHYNLFGSRYRSSAMSIIEDYLLMLKAGDMGASSPCCARLEVGGGMHGLVAGIRCQAQAGDMDALYMRRCVELARKATGHTSPNPMVGCVLVRDGQVVGEGFHPKASQPHAEVVGSTTLPDIGRRL